MSRDEEIAKSRNKLTPAEKDESDDCFLEYYWKTIDECGHKKWTPQRKVIIWLKDYIKKDYWLSEFLHYIWTDSIVEATLVEDLLDANRFSAWYRRRHALAGWPLNFSE